MSKSYTLLLVIVSLSLIIGLIYFSSYQPGKILDSEDNQTHNQTENGSQLQGIEVKFPKENLSEGINLFDTIADSNQTQEKVKEGLAYYRFKNGTISVGLMNYSNEKLAENKKKEVVSSEIDTSQAENDKLDQNQTEIQIDNNPITLIELEISGDSYKHAITAIGTKGNYFFRVDGTSYQRDIGLKERVLEVTRSLLDNL